MICNPARETLNGHARLMEYLKAMNTPYQEVRHPPEGRTEAATVLRGHSLREAAKSIVVMVTHGKSRRSYFNAVVTGDRRVDLHAVRALGGGDRAMFAPPERARELTGCPMGAVTPFSFHPDLALLADPELLEQSRLVFNAGLLDLSVALATRDYLLAAQPQIVSIALR